MQVLSQDAETPTTNADLMQNHVRAEVKKLHEIHGHI